MNRKQIREYALSALNAHPWFSQLSVRAVSLDGSPESTDAFSGDLLSTDAGAVLCVSQIQSAKFLEDARRGRNVRREVTLAILVRVNLGHPAQISADDAVDEVIKCLSGRPQTPGATPLKYVSEQLVQDAPAVIQNRILFTTTVLTEAPAEVQP